MLGRYKDDYELEVPPAPFPVGGRRMPRGNLASLVENYYTSLREESGTASWRGGVGPWSVWRRERDAESRLREGAGSSRAMDCCFPELSVTQAFC